MKLFSGTSNPQLAHKVSKLLNVPLARAEVIRFGNSEVKVTIQEDVKDETCVIIQSTSNPTDTNYMELFFFCDALKRQEAKKIVAVVPWLGYAKQNIQHRPGESVSANVVIEFLEAVGFDKVYVFDLHDEATAGVFTIPFENCSAFPLLAEKTHEFFKQINVDIDGIAIVSPDQGAVEKVRAFGIHFYKKSQFSEVVIEKLRNQDRPHEARPLGLYGNVQGKIALIVDDMVVSGSTIIPAADLCLSKGAKKVYAAAVHHDFTKDTPSKLQKSRIEKFFTTDTVTLKKSENFPKLVEISVAPLIAEELKKVS